MAAPTNPLTVDDSVLNSTSNTDYIELHLDTLSDTETNVDPTSSLNDKHCQHTSTVACTGTVAATDCDIGKLIHNGEKIGGQYCQLYKIPKPNT